MARKENDIVGVMRLLLLLLLLLMINLASNYETTSVSGEETLPVVQHGRNAYATMMYMGTPRDYEFYVAIRVMLRSLANLHADADRVVIASLDVPDSWVQAL
jgi:hypothetical protein|uniref:Uncharacterized protein n=1 Tax=Fagus sylvatica TaxID=28930 RepID=A0A2N9G7Q7_FAGSY